MAELAVVGKRIPRIDGPALARGKARFTADITLPGMLHGKILRSPHPHARLVGIDASKAVRLPGVKAVLTSQDIPRRKYGFFPDEYAMAVDKVRFVGDEVAAVAATSEEAATEAMGLISVQYEVLPAVFDAQEAMRPGAPQIHEGIENNISVSPTFHWGNIEIGFAESDYVREDTFSTAAQLHSTMEPHGAVASYDLDNGELTVWSSTQGAYLLSKNLSQALGMPIGKIRVIKPYVGGGLGGKWDMCKADVCAALLSMKTGHPVRLIYDREEVVMATRQRHPMVIRIKTGVRRDGTIMAKDCTLIADGGAYNSLGPYIVVSTGTKLAMLYRIAHIRFQGYRVLTNNPVAGPFRGFGQIQLRFADESQLDIIANELGIDPLELRLKNAVVPDFVTANKRVITSCGFRESIEKAGELIRWGESRKRKTPWRGVGLGCNDYVSGSRLPFQPDASNAIVKISEDGSATILTGAADIGQGSDTTLAMLASEEMGVPLSQVKVIAADTGITPADMGTFASRVSFVAGKAVIAAAADAKRQLFDTVAESLEAHPRDLDARDGRIYVKGSPDRGIEVAEAVKMSIRAGRGIDVLGKGYYSPAHTTMSDMRTAEGNPSPAYSFGTQAFEVNVDPETGQIEVVSVSAGYDCGRALNPLSLEGQVEGSVVCGMGQALSEQRVSSDGHTLNPSFVAYGVPTALEAPPVRTEFIETIDPEGPFGAKGMSEGAQVPPPAAISNALFDAIGVHVTDLPLTPEKVLKALEPGANRS